MWANCVLCVSLVLTIPVTAKPLQDQQQSQENSRDYYSGVIVDLNSSRLTVTRSVQGKEPENRTFLITPETVVEGKLSVRTRVTVAFKASDSGDVAVRIIVRGQRPSPREQ